MEELIKKIFSLQESKEKLEEAQTKLKDDISVLDTEIQETKKELLNSMKAVNSSEVVTDDMLYATQFSKETIAYKDEQEVLAWLKNNNYSNLVTVKTTEALNKKEINKLIKTDEALKTGLDNLTTTTKTEWVVVTNQENHEKMLEHIEDNSKSKKKKENL